MVEKANPPKNQQNLAVRLLRYLLGLLFDLEDGDNIFL
jgi:hypothetical protein